MSPADPRRLIIGISGASGVTYGLRLLDALAPTEIETHLVMTKSAKMTLRYETDLVPADLESRADVVYSNADVGAAISSGSYSTLGMIVAPCSVKTMSEIANGITPMLLSRAADVVLKERRRLVLLVRETPLHRNHLRTLLELTELGAVIAPPVPAFYVRPTSIGDIVDHTVGRALDQFGIDVGAVQRWNGDPPPHLPSGSEPTS